MFDKIAGANWKVPWHQDLTVALRERQDTDGFGPWSEKAGIVHAQAPVALLANMLTLRLHLDDCDETNGPLRVLPGTHMQGRLNAAQIQTLRTQIPPIACLAKQGGVVLMRPLLLHASSPAQTPRHRRVIHLEYAAADALPRYLQWHTQTALTNERLADGCGVYGSQQRRTTQFCIRMFSKPPNASLTNAARMFYNR